MDRRTSITTLAATLLATAGAARAQAGAAPAAPAQHQHQHQHHSTPAAASNARYGDLVSAITQCVEKGELCLAHCHQLLATGDTAMAACARTVTDMLAACNALRTLAAQGSTFVPAYAKLTAEVCLACEKECRKHADHHAACKACMLSCETCGKACRAAAA